jgi:hypothetical protein
MNKMNMAMPFTIPVIRLESKNHVDDRFFWGVGVSVTDFSGKNKHRIVYPNLNSAIRPIPMMKIYQFQSLQRMDCYFRTNGI